MEMLEMAGKKEFGDSEEEKLKLLSILTKENSRNLQLLARESSLSLFFIYFLLLLLLLLFNFYYLIFFLY